MFKISGAVVFELSNAPQDASNHQRTHSYRAVNRQFRKVFSNKRSVRTNGRHWRMFAEDHFTQSSRDLPLLLSINRRSDKVRRNEFDLLYTPLTLYDQNTTHRQQQDGRRLLDRTT